MQIAKKYGWQTNAAEESHGYLIPTVLDALSRMSRPDSAKVIDIGTGNGATLSIWKDQGWKVSAIEPDSDGFEFAKNTMDVDVRQLGVGDSMPQEWTECFDIAICLEVVEHLFDPEALVKTVDQVLKPGGIAVISTPYHGFVKNLALALADKWDFHHHPERLGGHIKFWSKSTLESLFTKGGFTPVHFAGAGRLPYLWKSMVLCFRKPTV